MDTPTLPTSKSVAARLLLLRAISGSAFEVTNAPANDDILYLTRALRGHGNGLRTIDVGESGTAMRFLTAYASTFAGETTELRGEGRLPHRPMQELVDALERQGARIEKTDSGWRVTGARLEGGDIEISGAVSSQYLSALLLIAPRYRKPLRLHVTGRCVSRPYLEMTLKLMEGAGLGSRITETKDGLLIEVDAGSYRIVRDSWEVEADWSSYSYFVERDLIRGRKPGHMPAKSVLQGDCEGTLEFLRLMETEGPVEMNFSRYPDLVPAYAVACAELGRRFRFVGLGHLRHKESDRLAVLERELRRLGYGVRTTADSLEWDGERIGKELEPVIATEGDHRMAMAFGTAGYRVDNPGCVNKSFPGFWEEIKKG